MYRIAVVLSILLVAACGGGSECDGAGDLALDGVCLKDLSVTARRDGAWGAGGSFTAEPVDGGYRVVLEGGDRAEGLRLEVPRLSADRVLQQGYQSWSFTGTVTVPPSVPLHDDGAPIMEAAFTGDPVHEVHGVSYHAVVVVDGTDGPAVVIGALSTERATTGIATIRAETEGDARIDLIYGPQREPLPADTDGVVRSEPLFIAAAASSQEALDRLGVALTAHHAQTRAGRRPPAGWFSWNERFADIDQAYIRSHIDVIADELDGAGMTLLEIDDGWQRAWGDWTANDRFADGMEVLATEISDAGLVAGIWMAPFLVDVTSDAAQGDPSLFVAGANGQPLVHQISGNPRDFYILDGTNPSSMAIATDAIAQLADDGYTFFKFDFLYAGAISGGRSQDVTGVQALRAGLAALREATGENAVINACGAPTLPMIGFADSMRVGPDTAFDGFDLSWSTIAAAARNLHARAHLYPLLWLDADQAQLRAPLDETDARAAAVVAALAGPAYSMGDDWTTLPSDRKALALDPAILDIAGSDRAVRALRATELVADEIATTPVIEAIRYPSGMAAVPPATFEIRGASGDSYQVTIDWEGDHSVTIDTLQP